MAEITVLSGIETHLRKCRQKSYFLTAIYHYVIHNIPTINCYKAKTQ